MQIVKKDDLVQARGLLNVKELNGKYGKVIKPLNKDGRVGVLFGAVSSVPKLIKDSNLVVVDKIVRMNQMDNS